ncbi:response regulator transcription factor [Saprospira grandis]|uniref:Two component transcriptional regulator, winged helix family protein n=1 Tax=Saprospira grandis (strain Lewin) TaxID=984262 RepID=H6L0A8_SAPGL|nr:response regulator transcription factor [Saprospira grandis]AFC26272.1 two component transcriptional regulator, winged helix family protein [Saprospira grandis str. Lewin]
MDHIARILLVEDEENIRETLSLNLELEGYEVLALADGKSVLPQFLGQHFDLILLDIMLPEMDGLDVCEQIRLHDSETPIIFLTAKDSSADKIQGLRKGADDYITKPFMLEELLLRIQILLKRSQNHRANTLEEYHFGPNYVNFQEQNAKGQDGQDFKLTKKEGMLLKLLIERAGEAVSRQQILQAVWGYDVYPSTRTIDNFILSFRKYFEEDPKNPQFFLSVRGVGYKFQAPEED